MNLSEAKKRVIQNKIAHGFEVGDTEVPMKNTYKNFSNEEQIKDYLLAPYLESLDKVCEYAKSEPEITRIAVIGICEDSLEVGVWLTDLSEEKCDKYGARIFGINESFKVFTAEFYPSGDQSEHGIVVYERKIACA